ncbi:polyprenyl synthetase family protein [Pseudomonas sp. WS 5018]|nr:polyprenyl synthetase family protein [Pseudomonas sp. WS 5018]
MQTQNSSLPLPQCDNLLRLRRQVDERLALRLPFPESELDTVTQALRESTLAPGKRLRPLLLLLALGDLDADPAIGLDPACALEMIHAASLFLDDMPCMDNASLRRGQPTIHLRFGEDVAVLASVALLSHAYGITATAPGLTPRQRNEAVAILARAVGAQGLVRGQFRDLHGAQQQAHPLDAATTTNQLKTGSLFSTALTLAGLLVGADRTLMRHLHGFAVELGLAFQLLDDIADGLSPEQTGKDCQQDRAKATVVSLLGPQAARQQLATHREAALAHLQAAGLAEGELASLMRQLLG